MAILGMSEMTLPGDLLKQGPAEPIYDRMAKVIRNRSLDMLNLMDDFLKRPAFSKMPTRNRAFLDIPTFRRCLCYMYLSPSP